MRPQIQSDGRKFSRAHEPDEYPSWAEGNRESRRDLRFRRLEIDVSQEYPRPRSELPRYIRAETKRSKGRRSRK